MTKRIIALLLVGLLAAWMATGCTGQKEQDTSSNALASTETSSQPEESGASDTSELEQEAIESSEADTASEEAETSGADASQLPADPEPDDTAALVDTTGFHTVSCEMPVINGNQPQNTQLTMTVDIPETWSCDYSILYDTAITDPALIEATGGQMKVGEFAGKRIDLAQPGLTAEEFFAQDAFQQEEMGEPLQVRQLELGGRSAYMRQWVSYPDGGVVDTWYPHAYYIWDGDGYLCLMLYSLEESDAETLALFDAVAATLQGAPVEAE